MMGFLSKLFGKKDVGLRAVPGAGVYADKTGKVVYNMLDPIMGQFMGRCVGAVKKTGIKAKGSGHFSILLGEEQTRELVLDEFWAKFQDSQDGTIFNEVAEAARKMMEK